VRITLERGGVSPEGASSHRARRSFGSTARGPSSEAEFFPRGARPTAWWAAEVARAMGSCHHAVIARGVTLQSVSLFVFLLFAKNEFLPGYWGTLVAVRDGNKACITNDFSNF
jgi:hypothetical protein